MHGVQAASTVRRNVNIETAADAQLDAVPKLRRSADSGSSLQAVWQDVS